MKTQEEIEQLAKEEYKDNLHNPFFTAAPVGYIKGYTQCQEDIKFGNERMYSEKELKSAFKIGFNIGYGSPVSELDLKEEHCTKWFEQFKNK